MKLTRRYLVKYHEKARSNEDRRKKGSMAIFSYYDNQGNEYRKGFFVNKKVPEAQFWNIAPEIINQ
jgi:hypothetical protein